ncbi:RNA polymerase sigma factor [Aestuariivirga sp.]|uniref:RNA polymerase sigma factor n=1 Tax=Aestuariivirga sp. TaxID=2650926 RepID=UPI003918F248
MSGLDEALAASARNGDRPALRRLLERHHDTAFRFSYRLLGSRADAQDVAQEVCIRLVERIASFRGDSRFSTWLYQLVLNACRDHRRRQGRVREVQAGYATFQADAAADWADSERKVRWLYLALDRLKPELKETALLILAEEVTQEDAASILGISAGTVAWRMSEVKKRLRAMAEHEDERA